MVAGVFSVLFYLIGRIVFSNIKALIIPYFSSHNGGHQVDFIAQVGNDVSLFR